MPTGLTETIVTWKSKGISNEKIRSPATSNNGLYLKLTLYNSKHKDRT